MTSTDVVVSVVPSVTGGVSTLPQAVQSRQAASKRANSVFCIAAAPLHKSGRARQRCAPSTAEYNNRGAGFNSLFCKKTEKSAFSCDSGCFSVQIVRHLIEQGVVTALQRNGEGVAIAPEQQACAAFKDKELRGIAALQRHRRDRAVLAVEKVNGVWVDRVLVIDEPLALRTIVDVAHRAGVVGNLGSCPVLRQVGEDDFFDDGRRVVVLPRI